MTLFERICACGQTLRGDRQRWHQIVTCPSCQRKWFVLPLSPYDLPPAELASGSAKKQPRRLSWRLALLGGAASTAVLLFGAVITWRYLSRPPDATDDTEKTGESIQFHMDAGRVALTQGLFRKGWQHLDTAVALRDQQPQLLTTPQNRDLNQLHRQADLLARFLTRPLREIVQQGKLVRDTQEWSLQFEDYHGRTVVFDDIVRFDADQRPELANHKIDVAHERVRVALEDLDLLQDLPINLEHRMIFGARLASCRREEGGVWVIRFEPDSGVLITDPDIYQGCTSSVVDDGVRTTLAQQHEWLTRGPLVVPARRGR